MSDTASYVSSLIERVPALRPVFQQHLADQGELLPHVFLGEVTRFVADLHRRVINGSAHERDEVTLSEILASLDEAMRSHSEAVHELVAVSFLENLERDDPMFSSLVSRLGPALRAELDSMDNWTPPR